MEKEGEILVVDTDKIGISLRRVMACYSEAGKAAEEAIQLLETLPYGSAKPEIEELRAVQQDNLKLLSRVEVLIK